VGVAVAVLQNNGYPPKLPLYNTLVNLEHFAS
jgi:hypothetical protein